MTHIIFSKIRSLHNGNAAVSRRHDFLFFKVSQKNPFHLTTRFFCSHSLLFLIMMSDPPEIPTSVKYDAQNGVSANTYFTKMVSIPDVEFSTEMVEAMYEGEVKKLRDSGIAVMDSNENGQQVVYSSPKIIQRSKLHLRNTKSAKLSVTKGQCLMSRLKEYTSGGTMGSPPQSRRSPQTRRSPSRSLSPSKRLFSKSSPRRSKWKKMQSPSRYMADPEMDFPNKYGGVATWASSLRS